MDWPFSSDSLASLGAGQAKLVLLHPADGTAGADEDVAATGAEPAGWVTRCQARQCLRFERGRQPQRGVLLKREADPCAGLHAEQGGDAEQEDHERQRGSRLLPGGFASAQQSRKSAHTDSQPQAAARDPRPPVHRQPGGDDLVPCQFGGFELSGLAGKAEVLARGVVEGVQPQGLFPGEDSLAGAVALPLGVAQVLQRPGGGLERDGLAEGFGCLRVVRGTVGSDSSLEKGVGGGSERSQWQKRGEQKGEGCRKSKVRSQESGGRRLSGKWWSLYSLASSCCNTRSRSDWRGSSSAGLVDAVLKLLASVTLKNRCTTSPARPERSGSGRSGRTSAPTRARGSAG